MLEKPPIGERCNACGLCCQVQVCSTGSFALGLVDKLGDRASGPCPALVPQADGRQTCGLIDRPKDWLPGNPYGVTPKLKAIAAAYMERHSKADINAAARLVFYSRI